MFRQSKSQWSVLQWMFTYKACDEWSGSPRMSSEVLGNNSTHSLLESHKLLDGIVPAFYCLCLLCEEVLTKGLRIFLVLVTAVENSCKLHVDINPVTGTLHNTKSFSFDISNYKLELPNLMYQQLRSTGTLHVRKETTSYILKLRFSSTWVPFQNTITISHDISWEACNGFSTQILKTYYAYIT